MRFPRQEIDVDEYLKSIATLLSDENCRIFLDTNILSQFYRLNDEARQDVYKWLNSCNGRIHVPVWTIQEYSRRVYSDNTQDYISELGRVKTYTNEFKNISDFIKGYISPTMLGGTCYADKKEELFDDLDQINNLLAKISGVIKNKLEEHKHKVHQEIIKKLESCVLKNDIYSIMKKAEAVLSVRYDAEIPPGFKDEGKRRNAQGDLVIWMEILEYCKRNDVKKAILLSRDRKSDMVYEPSCQSKGGRKASDAEKIRLAHESLVYEFSLATGSDEFYIVDFDTLVKLLAPAYRDLAKSFQISEASEQEELETNYGEENQNVILQPKDYECRARRPMAKDAIDKTENTIDSQQEDERESSYSGIALLDSQYESVGRNAVFDEYIAALKTYNWYTQNPALNKLMKVRTLEETPTSDNMDSAFVLGRNIIQSAEGSSGSAITFMENFPFYIAKWPTRFQQAMIDGMLFEVFFNSTGDLRRQPFKATYLMDLLTNIDKMALDNPYGFINKQLEKRSKGRFSPRIGQGIKYKFVFSFDNQQNVAKLECNGKDITDTYPIEPFASEFARRESLRCALSSYYGILEDDIEVQDIPANIKSIGTRVDYQRKDYLPF